MPQDRRKAEAIIPGEIWNFQAFKCQFPHPWGLLRVKYSPQNDHSANKRNHSQYFYSKFGKPRKNLVHVKITTWVQLIEIKLLWVVSPTLWQTSDKFMSSPLSKWTQQLILDSHLQSWLYCDTTGSEWDSPSQNLILFFSQWWIWHYTMFTLSRRTGKPRRKSFSPWKS